MAKKRTNKNRKQVRRQTRHFQLRVEHPIDQHVKEILDFKRANRSEVTAIRDGVRLLWALENNDLSVLHELFPHMKPQTAPVGGGGGGELSEIKSMLELVVAQQTTGGYLLQSAQPPPATTTGKVIGGFKALPPPPVEDVDDLLEFTASTRDTSSQNFMRMMSTL